MGIGFISVCGVLLLLVFAFRATLGMAMIGVGAGFTFIGVELVSDSSKWAPEELFTAGNLAALAIMAGLGPGLLITGWFAVGPSRTCQRKSRVSVSKRAPTRQSD